MKRLLLLLLTVTPWFLNSMELELLVNPEASTNELQQALAKGCLAGKEEFPILPDDIDRTIAQELCRGPIKQFIFNNVSVPFNLCMAGEFVRLAAHKPEPSSIEEFQSIFKSDAADVRSVKFNSNGDRAIACSSYGISLYDTNRGKLICTLEGDSGLPAFSAMFNQAGDYIITSNWRPIAKIWDAETGNFIRSLDTRKVRSLAIHLFGISTIVDAAAFTQFGDTVFAAQWNDTEKWDLKTLFESRVFLEKSISFWQAVVLKALFETIKVRGIVKALGKKAFKNGALPVSFSRITFDFNKYPCIL